MTEIYINGSKADLAVDESIVLNKEFLSFDTQLSDATSHILKQSSYSFTYTFPVTPTNIQIFRGTQSLDATDERFGVSYQCELYENGELLVNGRFNLTEITIDGYSGSIYVPQEVSIEDIFGAQKLSDLISDTVDMSNWDSINEINKDVLESPSTSLLCFPYVLTSVPSNNYSKVSYDRWTQSLDWSECGFDLRTLYPSFRVLGVLEKCFEALGWHLTGGALNKKYLSLLWQTYDRGQDVFDEKRKTPYYLSFDYTYSNYLQSNISSSLTTITDLDATWGADAVLQSENTILKNVNNDYGILVQSDAYGTYSIIVPQSGWYQINADVTMEMPNTGNTHYKQSGRTTVRGTTSDGDLNDLTCTACEFQIVKGSNPLANAKHYSVFNGLPTQTYDYSDSESRPTVLYGAVQSKARRTGIYPIESAMTFAVNEQSVPVRNLSGYATDDLVAGVRWGSQVQNPYWGYDKSKNAAPNRHEKRPATLCLPKSGGIPVFLDGDVDEDVASTGFQLYRVNTYKEWSEDYTYAQSTAVALTRADSYSNCVGVRKGTVIYDDDGDITSVNIDASQINSVYYPGQEYSSARVLTTTSGSGTVHTAVWLEEGDILNLLLISGYSEGMHRSNHWYSKLKWKDKGRQGVVISNLKGTFEMGFLNSNPDWVPTNSDPILTSSKDLSAPRVTRVGDLLPDVTAQEYLENILTTFNLTIKKTGANEYSLDENSISVLDGNVVNVDKVSDIDSAVYDRVDSATYTTFAWTNDLNEEGFVNGNDSPYCQDTSLYYNNPEHDGGKTIVDPLNMLGTEDKVQSTYSYNWYKTIWFRQDPLFDHSYYIDIPIISQADTWEEVDLSTAQQTIMSDGTPRLFYINTSLITDGNNGENTVVQKLDFIDGTDIKLTLIVPSRTYDRYTLNSTLNNVRKRYVLDYDDSNENLLQGDEAMSDTYFNTDRRFTYTLSVECHLSNSDFNKINSNTLIVFNDGLYNCAEIQEHHTDNASPTTLVLVPYKPRRASSAGLYTPQDTQSSTYCTYAAPQVTLNYDDIPVEGGCVKPRLEYSQTYVCDGVIGTITTGGDISYQGDYADTSTGEVCFNERNEESMRRLIDGVTVTVTLNGMSTSVTAQVYQAASTGACYEALKIERFSYPKIDWDGGYTDPEWTTDYKYTITVTCDDGSQTILHDGATMSWELIEQNSGIDVTLNQNTGRVSTTNVNLSNASVYICVVRLTVTYHDLEASATMTVHQDFTDEEVCEYYDPIIELTYPDLPAEGGSVDYTTFSYRFYYRCTDGTNGSISDGATVSFASYPLTGIANSETGRCTYTVPNLSTEREMVATITVTVTYNGVTGTYTTSLYQAAAEVTCTYSKPSIELNYQNSPFTSDGGTFMPSYSYQQTYSCTDGTQSIIKSGGELTFDFYPSQSTISCSINEYGYLTVGANTSTSQVQLGIVRMTVELNGQSNYAEYTVYIQGAEPTTNHYTLKNDTGYNVRNYEVYVIDTDGVERLFAQDTNLDVGEAVDIESEYEVREALYCNCSYIVGQTITLGVQFKCTLDGTTVTITSEEYGGGGGEDPDDPDTRVTYELAQGTLTFNYPSTIAQSDLHFQLVHAGLTIGYSNGNYADTIMYSAVDNDEGISEIFHPANGNPNPIMATNTGIVEVYGIDLPRVSNILKVSVAFEDEMRVLDDKSISYNFKWHYGNGKVFERSGTMHPQNPNTGDPCEWTTEDDEQTDAMVEIENTYDGTMYDMYPEVNITISD